MYSSKPQIFHIISSWKGTFISCPLQGFTMKKLKPMFSEKKAVNNCSINYVKEQCLPAPYTLTVHILGGQDLIVALPIYTL